MISRYKVEEIEKIWSDQTKFNNWMKIEFLNCEALNKLKIISNQELKEIKNNIGFNINDIYEIEKTTRHDVIAFTRAISKHMKTNAKKWIHYGLTSTDIVDTANAISLKESNTIIMNDLIKLEKILIQKANKYKYYYQIGRTHGMHAEITTFGLKLIGWVDELKRLITFFKLAAKNIEVGKISGAVGTFSNTPPFVQEYICKKLKIKSASFSTQIISRDIHSMYFDVIKNIGLSINKFATELRHLHRSEVQEISEYFEQGQKGSSAMPHKKNPISLENICGLSRMLEGYAISINKNVNLWHERDISHSSVERIVFLDAITLIVYILRKFINIIETMIVNKNKMLANIELSKDKIISGLILNYLVKNSNYSREDLYDQIQQMLLISYQENKSFIEIFKNSNLSKKIKNLDHFLNYKNHLQHIDYIFKKVLEN